MPSERFLAEHFQVARGTVRQEVNRLVADGVLYRQHGTATFTAQRQAAHIDMLTSFTEDMKARGVVPKTKVLHAEVESAGPRIAGRLNVPPGAKVFRLERLRYVEDEPFAVERTNLSVDRFPDIELFDWETQSLHRTLEERWGVHAEWNDTAISAVLPEHPRRRPARHRSHPAVPDHRRHPARPERRCHRSGPLAVPGRPLHRLHAGSAELRLTWCARSSRRQCSTSTSAASGPNSVTYDS